LLLLLAIRAWRTIRNMLTIDIGGLRRLLLLLSVERGHEDLMLRRDLLRSSTAWACHGTIRHLQ
jgi:hypothetical protein